MPAPSLTVSYNKLINDVVRLESYRASSLALAPKYQHLISEVILLRLFSLLENYIKDICCKIACEAPYRSGTFPVPILKCTSTVNALSQFENYNRRKPKTAKWTNSKFANETIKKVIPSTEKVRIELTAYALFYNEMRMVRNHVAHRTSSTYIDYRSVIRTTYGANLNISTGAFLVSTKRTAISKIDYYLRFSRAFANSLTS